MTKAQILALLRVRQFWLLLFTVIALFAPKASLFGTPEYTDAIVNVVDVLLSAAAGHQFAALKNATAPAKAE